jgi:hypothetical protein
MARKRLCDGNLGRPMSLFRYLLGWDRFNSSREPSVDSETALATSKCEHRNMAISRFWRHALASTLIALASTSEATAIDVSRGIYSISMARDNPNTIQDERLDAIRDYDFVSGYTLRVFWTDIEPAEGVYDFAVIDEALASVAALGQGMNLEILNGEEPAYVLAGASATYIDHRGGTNPVPWDGFARERMGALYDALANHMVSGPSGSHPLNQDPTLLSIDAAPAGLNFGVRDINGGIQNHPDYTQERYIDAVVDGIARSAAAFPDDTNFLAFFGFSEGQPGVPVDEQIIAQLAPLYNGPGQAKLDFFVENLSDDGPVPMSSGNGAGNNLLDWVNLGGDTMIQALDSWLAHRPDRDPQLDSLNPATGIELAYNAYGTRFFELYVADLDGAVDGALDAAGRPLVDDLRAWHRTLTSQRTMPGDYNADGLVDAADYSVWRDNLGSGVQLPNDDTPGVETDDYDRWKSHFGATSSGDAGILVRAIGVPEPTSNLVISFCGVTALAWRRRFASQQISA